MAIAGWPRRGMGREHAANACVHACPPVRSPPLTHMPPPLAPLAQRRGGGRQRDDERRRAWLLCLRRERRLCVASGRVGRVDRPGVWRELLRAGRRRHPLVQAAGRGEVWLRVACEAEQAGATAQCPQRFLLTAPTTSQLQSNAGGHGRELQRRLGPVPDVQRPRGCCRRQRHRGRVMLPANDERSSCEPSSLSVARFVFAVHSLLSSEHCLLLVPAPLLLRPTRFPPRTRSPVEYPSRDPKRCSPAPPLLGACCLLHHSFEEGTAPVQGPGVNTQAAPLPYRHATPRWAAS